MSERLNGIEAFVAAVEAGNFALAAERLHLTRSGVAKGIARLEQRLGTRLFNRTTRSQSLTEDGHAYYERCRRALAELDAADAAIEAGRQSPTGQVRLTMPGLIGRSLIAPLLLKASHRYPQLRFDLSLNDRVVDLVEDGLDLAVRSGDLGDSAVLNARALGHQWMGVYASPAYLAEFGQPDGLHQLMETRLAHRFVGYARDTGPLPWRFCADDGRLLEFTPGRQLEFSCNSLEVTLTAAIEGRGMARLPAWLVADALATGQLTRVFEETHPFGYALNAVWSQARALPLKTRVLVDLLAQELPPLLALR